jgi:acetate---CoA ligase (ADP-forming)
MRGAFPPSASPSRPPGRWLTRLGSPSGGASRPSRRPGPEGLRRDEAAAVVAAALGRGGDGWLEPSEVVRLAACYGLTLVASRLVPTAEDAGAAAEAFGGEVALKAVAAGLVHKTEAGGVRLGVRGAAATTRVARAIADHLADRGTPVSGFLVQPMVPSGVELLIGVVHDAQFGPVVACGAGGTYVELFKDVAVRLTPLAPADAAEMIRELKSYPLLAGFRGAPARDIGAVEDLLQRAATLADDLPEIAELDCNPVIVGEHGAVVVDARIRVQPVEPARPLGVRP